MGAGLNRWEGIGNLGRDAEFRHTTDGTPVATINVGCTRTWMKDGQKQERTEWARCVIFGKQAESLEPYLKKGKQVYVAGELQTREWEKDGQKKFTTEIRVNEIQLLGGGSGRRDEADQRTERSERENHRPRRQAEMPDLNDTDIPFSWALPLVLPALGMMGWMLG